MLARAYLGEMRIGFADFLCRDFGVREMQDTHFFPTFSYVEFDGLSNIVMYFQ